MKKFLIVVEISNDFEKISRCIDSIINQSFNDFDVLAINPYDNNNINQLLDNYKKKDNRISVINDYTLSNFHDIRMCGFSNCNAEYISFISSDDYLSCDYFRLMFENIEQFHSDINISSYVNDDNGHRFVYTFTNSIISRNVDSKTMLDDFFESCGNNNRLYKVEFKCIRSGIIKKFISKYQKISNISNVEDDIILSAMLYNCSEKISYVASCEYFMNYIGDTCETIRYDILKGYMSNNSLKKYIKYFKKWDINYNAFYSACYEYNDGLEKIKSHIMDAKIKVVSFDMFDTLVVRPFYQSSDLFELMDKEFINLTKSNPIIKFSKIRIDAESFLRKKNIEMDIEEVKIDEIYNYIHEFYSIPINIVDKLKKFEEELEIKFCYRRQTGYELYRLAKFLNKRVIVITDMYLNKDTIENILKCNNYDFDKIYLSSELLKTKDSGNLFEFVKEKEKNSILHIGDNLHSDIEMAKKNHIFVDYLPRAIDVFMGKTDINTNRCGSLFEEFDMYNINVNAYLKISGVRSSLAIIANKYFDNPFRNFTGNARFNSDPFLIGYYALGMQLLSLSNWILSDTKIKKYDSISFMSRDGYLPLNACKVLQQNTSLNKNINLNYVFISRRAMMPLLLSSKDIINIFQTYIDYRIINPKNLYEILKYILKEYNNDIVCRTFKENDIDFECFKTKEDFFNCLSVIYDNFLDKEKYDEYFKFVKEYFNNNFLGNAATFDIGYSGKPETLISYMLGKPIHTYFYHTTSSEAYSNSYLSSFELNTFYDSMPTLTGTVRELFYSDIIPSCIGYEKKDDNIVPIFGKSEKYTYFNKKIINIIQNSSLEFVTDFSRIFCDFFEYFDLNKFYMSIPYEYFNHYIYDEDRLIFNDLIFESNVNDSKLFTDYIDGILNDYRYYNKKHIEDILNNNYGIFKQFMCNKVKSDMYQELKSEFRQELGDEIKNELLNNGYTALPNKRIFRIIYYIVFDNKKMIEKIRTRLKKH